MNEHEEIEKALKARLSELRTHRAKVGRELHKLLPADSEDQAIELENQEALEAIDKTETTEILQIEARATVEQCPWALAMKLCRKSCGWQAIGRRADLRTGSPWRMSVYDVPPRSRDIDL